MAIVVTVVSYYYGGRGLLFGGGQKSPPGQQAGDGYGIPADCPADKGYIEAMIQPEAECVKSADVAGVVSGYEKTWGYFRRDPQFSYLALRAAAPAEIERLKALIGYHHACLSLAEGKDLCGLLKKKQDGETGLYDLMYLRCRKTSMQVGFAAYAAGYVSNKSYCTDSFRSFLFQGIDGTFTEKDFCGSVRKGFPWLGAVCNGGEGLACANVFPADGRNCRLRQYDRTDPIDAGEALEDMRDCGAYHDFYGAFLTGSQAGLSPEYGALYAAFVSKNKRSCEPLARAVAASYCSIRHRLLFQQKAELIRRDLLESDSLLRQRAAEADRTASASPK